MTDIQTTIPQHDVQSEVSALQTHTTSTSPLQDLKASPIGQARSISIVCLVFGIASIPLLNFVLGIIGLILARHALKTTPTGVDNRFARVGKICSIIGIVLSGLLIAAVIGFIAYQIYLSNKTMAF